MFLGLVVAFGVDGELAEKFPCGGVDDSDFLVLNEQDYVGSGVGSSDADVVHSGVDAQGDDAGVVDTVVSYSVVGVVVAASGWLGFWHARVEGGRCCLVR